MSRNESVKRQRNLRNRRFKLFLLFVKECASLGLLLESIGVLWLAKQKKFPQNLNVSKYTVMTAAFLNF